MDTLIWRNKVCAVFLLCAATVIDSPAQTFTTLAGFEGTNGAFPSVLIQAAAGSFYGTTEGGGAGGLNQNGGYGFGTIFRITAGGTLTTLHSFAGIDGTQPLTLIEATDGNLYGTTTYGGPNGNGTIFKITLGGTFTMLHGFGWTDGQEPAGPIQATDGNLYGTTGQGGPNGFGTVFKVTPGGTFTTLHSFGGTDGQYSDGQYPGGLIQAADGNFYGTTLKGGPQNGTIFKITPGGTLTTLYSFGGAGGQSTWLIQATDGNFYGTTMPVGVDPHGTIFEITPGGTFTALHSFGWTDGEILGGLIQATDGNFYGRALGVPGTANMGTIFCLAPLSPPAPALLPAIRQNAGVVNGASFQAGIVPNSWITIFGTNLSSKTDDWANAIVGGNLPSSLDDVSVSVGGQPAYISYISPTQINALAPNVGTGAVSVTVTNSSGTSSAAAAVSQTVQPAFFQWGSYAVATRLDFSPAAKNGALSGLATVPAKPGEVIILWGTGFGPTSPPAPVGTEVPLVPTYYTAGAVTVTVGSTKATVYGTALSPGYAGLYQVGIQIPPSLANGDYPVVATVSGQRSPSITLITVLN